MKTYWLLVSAVVTGCAIDHLLGDVMKFAVKVAMAHFGA